MSYILVLSTASNKEEAKKIANILVKEKLAACVNIIDNIFSVYEWKNEICEDNEVLMIIKTKKDKFENLSKKIKEIHSYEVPEIIALDITEGSKEYLNWIDDILK
ncbi:divalent-cation tolerance protein CutA [Nitrosophilus kaiyonis]|uniref:divalent-cation tolerance protein CutA n=1 Tax=Nitrosophilus kaiyonis TaxID=2930200 RepID=UPI00248FF31A|nr:divalent-cation tolerance protein CutA [Nitrosophilus kaiyonis]